MTGGATHAQVELSKPPSPPSEMSLLQSSPPVHSSILTWQRPQYAHSLMLHTARSSDAVTGAASSDGSEAAVATLESELLQARDQEALVVGHSGNGGEWQGAVDEGDVLAVIEELGRGQRGLECKAQISTQMPADDGQNPPPTLLLASLHADDLKQLPAERAAGIAVRAGEERGGPLADEPGKAGCAEEVGSAQFWQTADADADLPLLSPAAYPGTAGGQLSASASPRAAAVTAAQHAADASTADQAGTPRSASRRASEHAGPLDSAEASLQQDPASALHGAKAGTRIALSEEALLPMVPHHKSDIEAYDLKNIEDHAPVGSAGACGSSPDQAVDLSAPSVACGSRARHCLRARRSPRTKPSRMRRTPQEPRASSLRRGHDADILAALLALQLAVSDHSTAILRLKQASQPQFCCSLPSSPSQLRGLLTAHLDVAWTEEGSQGASSESPSHDTTVTLPNSKREADLGALDVVREQGMPHQPSVAAATDGSTGSIHSAGRPSQADLMQLCHTRRAIHRGLPSAAAVAGRRAPGIPSTLRTQQRPGVKQGAKQAPVSFNRVLQSWHRTRTLQAGDSYM